MEKRTKKSALKLFIGYFIIYPLYYVTAMFIATMLLKWYFDWTYDFSEKIFYIFSGVMWFVSYVAHFYILRLAWGILKTSNKPKP